MPGSASWARHGHGGHVGTSGTHRAVGRWPHAAVVPGVHGPKRLAPGRVHPRVHGVHRRGSLPTCKLASVTLPRWIHAVWHHGLTRNATGGVEVHLLRHPNARPRPTGVPGRHERLVLHHLTVWGRGLGVRGRLIGRLLWRRGPHVRVGEKTAWRHGSSWHALIGRHLTQWARRRRVMCDAVDGVARVDEAIVVEGLGFAGVLTRVPPLRRRAVQVPEHAPP